MSSAHEEIIKVHHGRNIKKERNKKGMKQEVLAPMVGMSQQTLSRYESMQIIDDEILVRVAKALEVPLAELKDKEEDTPTIIIENNTFENDGNNYIATEQSNHTTINNPIDQVVDLLKDFIAEERRKNDLLEQLLKGKK